MSGPSWAGLAWAALPLLGVLALLVGLRLGQAGALAVSAARLVVQLVVLGAVLGWVFGSDSPWVVGLVALGMLAASGQAVGARWPRGRSAWALRWQAFGVLAVGAGLVLAVGMRLSLGLRPWYEPSTVIPMLGMILGNSVNGVALAADRLDAELRTNRDLVELRLALGATAGQAAREPLRAAVGAGLLPTIQNMALAGVVSIPGMMTGQILAGAPVDGALRYQILIYLLIAGTVGISTLLLLAIRLRRYFTRDHQLRGAAFEDSRP